MGALLLKLGTLFLVLTVVVSLGLLVTLNQQEIALSSSYVLTTGLVIAISSLLLGWIMTSVEGE